MKNTLKNLTFLILLMSCAENSEKVTTETNDTKQNTQVKSDNTKKIPDPINLEYEYYNQIKLEDGSPAQAYIEKGKKESTKQTGDYAWTKMIPLYASNEVKYVFEYQMDFSDSDFDALKTWLIQTMGNEVKEGSLDNPSWYNKEMTLTETYEYCKQYNKNITIAFFSESKKYMTLVIIDSGSEKTRTEAEMALVFTIFN